MSEQTAVWVVRALGLYALIGVVFALAFVSKGVGRIDPDAREGTRGFRLAILPGVAALWPLLLKRWWGGQTAPPVEHNAHRRAAQAAASATDAAAEYDLADGAGAHASSGGRGP